MRAQSSTEALVALAVVVVIALAVASFLSFYPSMSADSKVTESQIYWQSATPLKVTEVTPVDEACGENTSGYKMTVENARADSLTLKGVKIDGTDSVFCTSGGANATTSMPISIAGKAAMDLVVPTAATCVEGQLVEMDLAFIYDTQHIPSMAQKGDKKMVVKCATGVANGAGGGAGGEGRG